MSEKILYRLPPIHMPMFTSTQFDMFSPMPKELTHEKKQYQNDYREALKELDEICPGFFEKTD